MGIDYGNVDSYDYFHYEPFIPIFFNPKFDDENKISDSNIEFDESESLTRKSTLDIDDEEINKSKSIKIKDPKDINFKKIFKKLKNSPFFEKNENNKLDEDDYYLNFDENDNIRKSYYSKLIFKNVWNPGQKPKTHNNLFIFDWDDTLLPTSFLNKEEIINNEDLPEEYIELFSILEESVLNILNLSLKKGDVYIITNSSIGWVQFSAEKYYPKLKSIINKINIISARNEYEDSYPGEAKLWKQKAFLNLKNKINLNLATNIICVGDSIFELEAGKILASKINNSFIKTIKLKQNPCPEDLVKQLDLIGNKFNYIYSQIRNISIKIDKKI
jgi:hypothetical protein